MTNMSLAYELEKIIALDLFEVEIGGFEPPTSAMRTQRSPY